MISISIGDVIAAVQLAYKLYQTVRAASELRGLSNDLRLVHFELDSLRQECQDPFSLVAREGEHRIAMVRDIIDEIKGTLERLDRLMTKYSIASGKNGMSSWDKVKFALHSSKLKDFESKLERHKSSLALLRSSVASSSCERMESRLNRQGNQAFDSRPDLLSLINEGDGHVPDCEDLSLKGCLTPPADVMPYGALVPD